MYAPDISPAPRNIHQYIHDVDLYKVMHLICCVFHIAGLNNKLSYHADKTNLRRIRNVHAINIFTY